MNNEGFVKRFFITGLPRSRTAWFAQFFSTGNVSCLHDGLNLYPNEMRLSDAMSGDRYAYGNSDSGLMFSQFQEWFDAPTVIIERDPDTVIESLSRIFGESKDVENLVYTAELRLARLNGLRVQFEDINDRLEEIWDHCLSVEYDRQRGEQMKNMKIETMNLWGNPDSLKEVMSWLG